MSAQQDPDKDIITVIVKGGLGNNLFMIASAYGHAKKHNKKFKIYRNRVFRAHHSKIDYLTNIFSRFTIEDSIPSSHTRTGEASAIRFQEMPTSTNVQLFDGYLQSEKYFYHCKSEIQNMFYPSPEIITTLKQKYPNLDKSLFIHIRRTDVINHPVHYVDLSNYYKNALTLLQQKHKLDDITFVIVSDDIDGALKNELNKEHFNNLNKLVIRDENELNTLYIMCLCKLGGITANSTFSWWGSYLNTNPDKFVTIPSKTLNIPPYYTEGYEGAIIVSI